MDFLARKRHLHTLLYFLLIIFPEGSLQSVVFSKPLTQEIDPELQPYQSASGEVAGSL